MRSELKYEKIEQVLQGSGPWQVGGSGGDGTLRLLHTPGRTFGGICARYAPRTEGGGGEAAIFTGGLAGYNMRLGKLDGYSAFNRGGIERQVSPLPARCPPAARPLPARCPLWASSARSLETITCLPTRS